MLSYEIVNNESETLVLFNGDLDFDASELMEEEITPLLQDKAHTVLDFSNVSFVDSSGIGLLISFVTHMRDRGNKVEIIRLNPDVKQVFIMLQLTDILGEEVFLDFH
jgi:anti-anti-sigma factor